MAGGHDVQKSSWTGAEMCQCCVPPDKISAVGPSREKKWDSPCSLHHNCFVFFLLVVGNKLLCAKFSSNTFMQREVPAAQKSLSLPSPGAAQAPASSTGFAARSILLVGGFPSLGSLPGRFWTRSLLWTTSAVLVSITTAPEPPSLAFPADRQPPPPSPYRCRLKAGRTRDLPKSRGRNKTGPRREPCQAVCSSPAS